MILVHRVSLHFINPIALAIQSVEDWKDGAREEKDQEEKQRMSGKLGQLSSVPGKSGVGHG